LTDANLTNEKWQIVLGCLEDMGEKDLADELSNSFEVPEWQKEGKITVEELAKFLGSDNPEDIDVCDMDGHFTEYEGWTCNHCDADIPNDQRDMARHLMKHTLEELKSDCDECHGKGEYEVYEPVGSDTKVMVDCNCGAEK
jgi:hypothetical protein